MEDKSILEVTKEEFEYFKKYKPLHYITLNEMIRHGEAKIIGGEIKINKCRVCGKEISTDRDLCRRCEINEEYRISFLSQLKKDLELSDEAFNHFLKNHTPKKKFDHYISGDLECPICGRFVHHTFYINHSYGKFRSCRQCELKAERLQGGINLLFSFSAFIADERKNQRRKDREYLKNREKIKIEPKRLPLEIKGTTCCQILKSHHDILKDDPERLSTDFIKSISKCDCKNDLAELQNGEGSDQP